MAGVGAGGVALGLAPTESVALGVEERVGVGETVGPGVGPTTYMRQAPGQAFSLTYASPVELLVARPPMYFKGIKGA